MNHEPNKISIGEHMIRTQMFLSRLSDMMPQIEKTVCTLIEIKKRRRLLKKEPQEHEEQDSSITEQSI